MDKIFSMFSDPAPSYEELRQRSREAVIKSKAQRRKSPTTKEILKKADDVRQKALDFLNSCSN